MKKNEIEQKIKKIMSNYYITSDKNINFKILAEIAQLRIGRIKEGEEYINNNTKMTFIDKLGNEFEMTPSAVKRGQWSPFESGAVFNNPEYHMKQLQEIVFEKGGKIKDGEYYINAKTKMIFIDQLGNEFEMTPGAVKRGQWSPFESGNVRDSDYHMKQLQEIVSEKGGKIKDGEEYINSNIKMTFIDQLGNEFKLSPSAVKNGSWSPYEKNCLEHICRQIIEQLYDKKFPSSWDVIKRKNGNKLQLDGYCQELNIAFEYQGMQHSTGWFHKDKSKQEKSLIKIQERDNEKKQICMERNILLLEINYYQNIKNSQDIIKQTIKDVKKSYEKLNYNLPDYLINIEIEKIKIDFSKISNLVIMQKELENIVFEKGGKIKEGEQYIDSNTKMTFNDQFGNEFKMTPSAVKSGQWSPYESGNVRDPEYHMKQLQEIIFEKGGKIKEGEQYINNNTKMIFIDKLGNEFEMSPHNVKSGQWSPFESKLIRDPEYHMKQLQEIVFEKGGKIKEGEQYINNNTKMIFIDKLENEFEMLPRHVKSGSWSPYESGSVRDSEYHMKQLQEIVSKKGGKIKDGEYYTNAKTKMAFIDELGNEFKMTPNNIKNGQWSPFNSRNVLNHNTISKQIELSVKKIRL